MHLATIGAPGSLPEGWAAGRRVGPTSSVAAPRRLSGLTMIDLHCHILPGLDDGPADAPTALDMLRAYEADGVDTVVATPHLRSDFPDVVPTEIAGRCVVLEDAGAEAGTHVQVVPGGELSLTWALGASDAELHAASLDGLGADLLIETPPNALGSATHEALFEIGLRGYRITLAHPELSPSFQRAPERLARLVDKGILLQVTASALQRSPRKSASASLAQALVRDGLCAAVASDAHSPGPWRAPELVRGVAAAARLTSPAQAEWLVRDAPDAILAGEPLPALPSAPATPRGRSWLRRRAGV